MWWVSWVHRGIFSALGFPYKFSCFPNDLPPHLSWYPPVYSWYPSSVLNTQVYLWYPPPVYCTDIMQGENAANIPFPMNYLIIDQLSLTLADICLDKPYKPLAYLRLDSIVNRRRLWGVFSTLGDIMSTPDVFSTVGGGGGWIPWVQRKDIMSTAGAVQYSGEIPWVHWGIPWWVWRISWVHRGYHNACGGYHEYTGGYSVHWGFHTNSVVFLMTFPHIYHDIPQCTHGIPQVYWTPQCIYDILPRCTAQTLCRVRMQLTFLSQWIIWQLIS